MRSLAPLEYLSWVRAPFRVAMETRDPRLEITTMGLRFPSPIGLAAGLDKNADRARALASLGFGHLELGTVTAIAQEANPRPNMFRLPKDRALVNRLGFPNEGAAKVAARVAARKETVWVPIGISIGKSRVVPVERALDDYLASFRAVAPVADFVVVNVSSPNTKDLRALQASDAARPIFEALTAEGTGLPILVKIAPDLPDASIDAICDEAMRAGLAGVVATNTTISRDDLESPASLVEKIGAGGLSGKPLFSRALSVVGRVRRRVGPKATVIGVGGVDGVESALAMMRAGANLVQVYTGFVYKGPGLARTIANALSVRMDAEGVSSIADLVRSKHEAPGPDARLN